MWVPTGIGKIMRKISTMTGVAMTMILKTGQAKYLTE